VITVSVEEARIRGKELLLKLKRRVGGGVERRKEKDLVVDDDDDEAEEEETVAQSGVCKVNAISANTLTNYRVGNLLSVTGKWYQTVNYYQLIFDINKH
jgi:hypothetical protein